MSDDIKRHVAIGIALNNVLVPQLKRFVDSKLISLYEQLVIKYKIDSQLQSSFGDREQYKKIAREEGFQNVKPNDPLPTIICSHHELAKLYLQPFMRHFNNINDEKFDASAALMILEKASCFKREEKDLAKKIKQNTRNPWAHCNFREWDDNKFLESFKDMKELGGVLTLPREREKAELLEGLDSWKENGLRLIGNNVDISLLQEFYEEFQKTMHTIANEKVDMSKFDELKDQIYNELQMLTKRQTLIETEQVSMKQSVTDNSRRITNLESSNENKNSPLYIIPQQNKCFVGREEKLVEIIKTLHKESGSAVAIYGLGGVGKTTLALEVARAEHQQFPGGVYWLTADADTGDNSIKSSLFGMARKLEHVNHDIAEDRIVEVVTSHLTKLEHCLLVIDNLDGSRCQDGTYSQDFSDTVEELVNGMWVSEAKVSMLITSRLKKDHLIEKINRPCTTVHLESFSREEGVDFLRKRTNISYEQIDAQELVLEVGGLPLALDQAAAYLKISKCKLSSYLDKLKRQKLKLLDKEKAHNPTGHVDKARLAVLTTWSMNMECIREEYPIAEKLTHVLAFLSPRCIPKSIINEGSPRLKDDDFAEALSDDFEVADMLYTLTKLSLFQDTADNSIQVHRMVQEIIRAQVKADNCLENTLQNAQKMLCKAIDLEESPKNYLEQSDIKWQVESLIGWSLVMENVGHFIEELKTNRIRLDSEHNNSAKLLDHVSLYYYVLNQSERATAYTQLMNEHLSKVNTMEVAMYRPQFRLPRTPKEKESLAQLIETQIKPKELEHESQQEMKSVEAKTEGNFYMEQKNYKKALEAYNISLKYASEEDVTYQVSLNRCKAFYKLDDTTNCIAQAEKIMSTNANDPKAYLWLALAYEREEKKVKKDEMEPTTEKRLEQLQLERESFARMRHIFGALSLHFSTEGDEMTRRVLASHSLNQSNFMVIFADSVTSLEIAVAGGNLFGQRGDMRIIMLRPGIYKLDSLTTIWPPSIVVGDMNGPKPTILIEDCCPNFISKTIFVNVHFKMIKGQLTINLQENSALFLKCSFEADSPMERKTTKKGIDD